MREIILSLFVLFQCTVFGQIQATKKITQITYQHYNFNGIEETVIDTSSQYFDSTGTEINPRRLSYVLLPIRTITIDSNAARVSRKIIYSDSSTRLEFAYRDSTILISTLNGDTTISTTYLKNGKWIREKTIEQPNRNDSPVHILIPYESPLEFRCIDLRRTFLGWEIIESEKRTGEELAYISKTTWNKLFRKTKSYVISDNQWRLSSIGWKSRNRKSEKRIDYWDPGDRLSRRKTFYRYKYNSYGQVTEELMSTDKRRYVNSKTIYFYEYY